MDGGDVVIYRTKIDACKTLEDLYDYIAGRRRAAPTEFPTQQERWYWLGRMADLMRQEGKGKRK